MPSGKFAGIGAGVMFHRLIALLLLAVAMTLAPLGMPAMAEASPPAAAHHGAMASEAHCDEQSRPAGDNHGQADGKNCCAAMCVAVVLPSGAAGLPAYHGPSERPAPDRFRLGYLGEIATPPPKRA